MWKERKIEWKARGNKNLKNDGRLYWSHKVSSYDITTLRRMASSRNPAILPSDIYEIWATYIKLCCSIIIIITKCVICQWILKTVKWKISITTADQ